MSQQWCDAALFQQAACSWQFPHKVFVAASCLLQIPSRRISVSSCALSQALHALRQEDFIMWGAV